MERLDFCSVTTVLRRYISEDMPYRNGIGISQIDFLYILFDGYFQTGDVDNFVLDNGLVCRWMNGQAKVSPRITGFYLDNKNRTLFVRHFEENILPLFFDAGLVITELHDLLVQDNSISEMQRKRLNKEYPCDTEDAQAAYIVSLLLFGMERHFVKREAKAKKLLTVGSLSPVVADYIYENDVPKPCRFFCGRDRELETLHQKLLAEGKVFLHGIAGIGKSELAKAYAKQYKKEYTNILYLTYSGNLMQDIADMDFSDDLPEESRDERFRKHNRFLRSLRDDTLIIIDNFNTTAIKDSFLPVILKYRCRLLFTTRSRIESQPCMLLEEIRDKNALLELAGHYYMEAPSCQPVMEQLIETVHSHTFAVELSARLLQSGILEPEELLKKLREEKTGLSATDKIGITKDGENRRATYYDHLHTLFSLYCLDEKQTELMRCLSLVPLSGIPARLFAIWMRQPDMNHINSLVEMGFIQPKNGRMISLHPMLQEITVTDTRPSVTSCRTMMDYQRKEIFYYHGIDVPYFKLLFATVLNMTEILEIDDKESYLRFLEDAFTYMDKYHFEDGMKKIVAEMEYLLKDKAVGEAEDRALLLDYQAALAEQFEHQTAKAIKLEQEALALLPEITADNALLASNLHANMGALYHTIGKKNPAMGKNNLAARYMEQGIAFLEQYGLIYINQSVAQICNYAVLLCDMGEPERGLSALRKCAKAVKEFNSEASGDYAAIQEAMGNINLACGRLDKAKDHLQKAMTIYEQIWSDEPELIEHKYEEIKQQYAHTGLSVGRSLLKQP